MLLGVKTYQGLKLVFDDHVKGICKKANKKLKTLARATPDIRTENKNQLTFFSVHNLTY